MTKAKRWSLSSMPEPVVLASDYDALRLQLSRAREWMQHIKPCDHRIEFDGVEGIEWGNPCTCGLAEFLKEVGKG